MMDFHLLHAGSLVRCLKALAKRTRKLTQVLDLRSTCVSFGHPLASTCIDLRRLAWTCVDFGRAQIWTQVDASFLPFGHPAQVNTSWSQVICCYKNAFINDMREIYGFLWLASRLANPFGHLLQVRVQVLVLQTCIDMCRLANLFGQGFSETL